MHKTLTAIHQSSSTFELEQKLNEILAPQFELTFIRIEFLSLGNLTQKLNSQSQMKMLKVPLFHGQENFGNIYFFRLSPVDFKNDEVQFLAQVGEAVGLALDRSKKMEQSEALKQQWESTFDAILSPLSIIDQDYNIVRTNLAYAKSCDQPIEKLPGKKCYDVMFKRKQPCEGCVLGERFRLRQVEYSPALFEVQSQNLALKSRSQTLYLQIYRDISDQIRLEHQLLESAKMAELGTVGSSIAHEINNPLGGIINFLQLMKMDLKGSEPYFSDIIAMEKGAMQCKEIVENLLGFTRRSSRT